MTDSIADKVRALPTANGPIDGPLVRLADVLAILAETDRVPVGGGGIHGFANGYFGRDSYACRTIMLVGAGVVVTRNDRGETETISESDFAQIADPADRGYCDCPQEA